MIALMYSSWLQLVPLDQSPIANKMYELLLLIESLFIYEDHFAPKIQESSILASKRNQGIFLLREKKSCSRRDLNLGHLASTSEAEPPQPLLNPKMIFFAQAVLIKLFSPQAAQLSIFLNRKISSDAPT